MLLGAAPSLAQEAARSASRCEVPADQLASPAPLPRVVAALKSSKELHILTIGSPIGVGRGPRKSYPVALENLLERALTGIDVIIVNRPVSGETAFTAAERIRTEVALSRPDLLIWQVGANDALARVPPAEYEAALSQGVRWARANGIDVLLVGFEANPWLHDDAEVLRIRETTARVAKAEDVLYLRRFDAMQFLARARGRVEQGDKPFPAEIGDDCMAELVAQALAANLVLRRTRPTGGDP
ncbi:GDSL-type esterase/lipase family protein [uncultured Rhodoblastus sp.]|uniref:SGNH/GDSL hydrolase family protein n=1 Tax=uncultured Rhodoblastus sp. TaxID=543037 RepID=UPI0025DCCCE6|nr:GDSL-type esterase/lipase family protein [uncultured Rhodoblastus sp.]